MMGKQVTNYVASWFARADEDLDVAKLILDEERPCNPACFHEQQAAEKYLKGFLAHHEKHVRKIHDLDALLQECIKIDQSFEDLRNSTRYLSRFYIESRYPDDYVEFTREDAKKGFEAALRIKEFILEKIVSQKKNGFGVVGVVITIAAVAVLGGFFGYQYLKFQKIREEAPIPAAEPSAPPPVSTETRPKTNEIDTTSWKTYHNEKYGFEIQYPTSEYPEVRGVERDTRESGVGAIELHYLRHGEKAPAFEIFITRRPTNMKDVFDLGQLGNSGYTKLGLYDAVEFLSDTVPQNFVRSYLLVNGTMEYTILVPIFPEVSGGTPLDQILTTFRFTKPILETGPATYCASNKDCWCQGFTGSEFLKNKVESTCNTKTNRCDPCFYF